jgi:uncharacterized OB-fold protein
MSKTINDLKKRCTDENISMNKLCQSVGVRRELISRYDKKTPVAIAAVEALTMQLDKMKAVRLGMVVCGNVNCGEIYASTKEACPQCGQMS